MIARCAIYEQRPEVCRVYPDNPHEKIIPPECTYTFDETGARSGECGCGVGACCAIPRLGGEPDGVFMLPRLGGRPCKHLMQEDVVQIGRDRMSV